MSEETVKLTIDGRNVESDPAKSIIQAFAESGGTLVSNVGCMGQGVCGSCRCMVRRKDEKAVQMQLACETPVEEGMQVAFVSYFEPKRPHVYDLETVQDSWELFDKIDEIFPQAKNCRHCSGCDRACPRGLDVQKGVELAVKGDVHGAAEIFAECIMCNLCTLACPERIRPNHLGMFLRRASTALSLRPVELMQRVREIESGKMTVNTDTVAPADPKKK
jgi:succinate dehydrogenase/fumarate reductase-like Fe-S protein